MILHIVYIKVHVMIGKGLLLHVYIYILISEQKIDLMKDSHFG